MATTGSQRTWEVVVVRHGTRATRRSDVYMGHAVYGEPDDDFTVDYHLWLLRSGDDVVVVDTGYSAAGAAKRGRDVVVDPIEALRHLGVDAHAGHPVIVTHAHYDHIGNLAAFDRSPIHVAAAELAFWTSDVATRPLFAMYGDREEVAELVRAQAEGRVALLEDATEIADGVEAIVVGGHTPGQLVVRVRTAAGPVLLAADAAHFQEELDRDMPFHSMADLPRSYEVLDWLRAEREHAIVVTGHDAGEVGRFEPLDGPLAGLASVIGRAP